MDLQVALRLAAVLSLVLAVFCPPAALAQPFLVVTDTATDALYSMDANTAAVNLIGEFSTAWGADITIGGLAYDANSRFLYGSGTYPVVLYMVSGTRGWVYPIGSFGATVTLHGLAFDNGTGILYGVDYYDGLFTIDPVTGVASLVGGFASSFVEYVYGLAVHPATGVLYAGGHNLSYPPPGEFHYLVTIDKATGRARIIGEVEAQITALAFHPQTHELYGLGRPGPSQPSNLYRIDVETAQLTYLGEPALQNPIAMEFIEPGVVIPTANSSWSLLKSRFK